jgi:hypothetical protein
MADPFISSTQIPQTTGLYGERQVRTADREEMIEDAADPVPVEAMSEAQVNAYNAYLNTTLSAVDSLRYPALPDLNELAVASPSRETRAGTASAPAAGTAAPSADPALAPYERLAAVMGRNVDSKGKQTPLTKEQKHILGTALSGFDSATVENMNRLGVKIRIYDPEKPPPGGFPGQEKWNTQPGGRTLAFYNSPSKTVCFRQDSFTQGIDEGELGTMRHEFGHVVDDMLAADNPADKTYAKNMSISEKRLGSAYKDYMERADTPSALSDDPSWRDNAYRGDFEYWAEGVRLYTGSDEEKQKLKEAEPDLYALVEEKLGQSKGPLPKFEPEKPRPLTQEEIKAAQNFFAPMKFNEAIFSGNMKEMKELMGQYPDLVKGGGMPAGIPPIQAAVITPKNSLESVKYLISAGADPREALKYAREAGKKDIVAYLRTIGVE